MKAKKTILVVGGAGFIGSHVNKCLHEAGYETIVFDNLCRGSEKAIVRGTFVEGDLGNSSDLDNVLSNHHVDAVMHFAAYTDVGESVENPSLYYQNNVCNTLNLLDAMKRHQVNTLVFSSSAAIFGIPKEKLITESHPCLPINPYGQTKLTVEKMLQHFDGAYSLKSCSLRYFNAAGGDPDGEIKNYKQRENNLIPLALRSLKDKGTLTIFGTDYPTPDGTCLRDYIHVYDLAQAHIAALEKLFHDETSCNFNLGNGQGFSVREVIQTTEKVTKQRLNAIEGPRRPGDPPILLSDSQKAFRELGWHPKYPDLESIITHAWQAIKK